MSFQRARGAACYSLLPTATVPLNVSVVSADADVGSGVELPLSQAPVASPINSASGITFLIPPHLSSRENRRSVQLSAAERIGATARPHENQSTVGARAAACRRTMRRLGGLICKTATAHSRIRFDEGHGGAACAT